MDIHNAVEMEANLFGVVNDTHDKKEGILLLLPKDEYGNFSSGTKSTVHQRIDDLADGIIQEIDAEMKPPEAIEFEDD